MRYLVLLFVLLQAYVFGQTKKEGLNSKDIALMESIDFDKDIFAALRAKTDSTFYLFDTSERIYEEQVTHKVPNGVQFNESTVKARLILWALKREFKKKGYLIFIKEQHFGYEPDQIAVVKTTGQFDLLRVMETNGINHGLETDDVIAKLKEWDKLYSLEIISCSYDMVEAQFGNPPADMEKFAQEVYEFCPDVVDQGSGSVKELAKEMKKGNVLYLWWD